MPVETGGDGAMSLFLVGGGWGSKFDTAGGKLKSGFVRGKRIDEEIDRG